MGLRTHYDDIGPILKSVGMTKLAGITYNGIGAGFLASMNMFKQRDGIANCYTDVTVPIGGTSFTVDALAISHAGCNGVYVAGSPKT